jgi:hypothetical protein
VAPPEGFTIKELCPIVDVVGPRDFVWQWPSHVRFDIGLVRLTELSYLTVARADEIPRELLSRKIITVGGGKSQHPFHITLWQWIGADSTRNPTLTGGTATSLLCVYTAPESGRIIVKMFVGGGVGAANINHRTVSHDYAGSVPE